MTVKEVQKNIESIREERGMSIGDFVEAIGISRQGYIHMTENATMKLETLIKSAEALDVPIMTLFEGLKEGQENKLGSASLLTSTELSECRKRLVMAQDKIIELQDELLSLR